MKTQTASLAACLLQLALAPAGLFAGETKEVTSKLDQVTVYLQGCRESRAAAFSAPAGATEVVITGLSRFIDANSIQVAGKGSFIIQSAGLRISHTRSTVADAAIRAVEDSIALLEEAVTATAVNRQAYEEEQQMIVANRQIGGANTGVTTEELKKAAEFFRTRLLKIRTEIAALARQERKLNERLQTLRAQLAELNGKRTPTGEVVVKISAKAAVNGSLSLSCFIPQAGWAPVYDIRADDIKGEVQLLYKAGVWQNTGIAWKDVKMTLSTGNPTRSGTQPVLQTWYVDFWRDMTQGGVYKGQARSVPAAAPRSEAYMDTGRAQEKLMEAETPVQYTAVTQHQLSTEFIIDLPYDVLSDGKQHLIDVQEHRLTASYHYFCAPKIDKDVFLIAKVTGWEQYNLLPGAAHIFFEGAYVGESWLDPNSTADTLSLSFGRDRSVVVERKNVKDFTRKQTIGNKRKDSYAWEVSIRNTRKDGINIVVEENIPVSRNKEIEVKAEELGGAAHDAVTGKLTWRLQVTAAKTETLKFSFTVEYPKDKKIML